MLRINIHSLQMEMTIIPWFLSDPSRDAAMITIYYYYFGGGVANSENWHTPSSFFAPRSTASRYDFDFYDFTLCCTLVNVDRITGYIRYFVPIYRKKVHNLTSYPAGSQDINSLTLEPRHCCFRRFYNADMLGNIAKRKDIIIRYINIMWNIECE